MLAVLKPDERTALDYIINEVYAECEETYVDAKGERCAYLNELKRQLDGASGSGEAAPQVNLASRSHQLPHIDLPKCSGSSHEWRQFRDILKSMISTNQAVSKVEKMQYLKTCLTGEAAQLVIKIEITETSFVCAWQVLVGRCENKRVLIDTQLASLFSIRKVSQQSVSVLKTLLAEVQEALGAL